MARNSRFEFTKVPEVRLPSARLGGQDREVVLSSSDLRSLKDLRNEFSEIDGRHDSCVSRAKYAVCSTNRDRFLNQVFTNPGHHDAVDRNVASCQSFQRIAQIQGTSCVTGLCHQQNHSPAAGGNPAEQPCRADKGVQAAALLPPGKAEAKALSSKRGPQ